MKLHQLLNTLKVKLEGGELQDVAAHIEAYFVYLEKDDLKLLEAKRILDEISVLANKNILHGIKEVKKGYIKDNLSKIIKEIEVNKNIDSTIEEKDLQPTNAMRKKFAWKFKANDEGLEGEVTGEGDEKTVNKAYNFSLILLGTVLLFLILFFFKKCWKPDCDCTQFKELETVCVSKINKFNEEIIKLDNEIKEVENSKLTNKNIEKKETIYDKRRNLTHRLDSLKVVLLPDIQAKIAICPDLNCEQEVQRFKKILENF